MPTPMSTFETMSRPLRLRGAPEVRVARELRPAAVREREAAEREAAERE